MKTVILGVVIFLVVIATLETNGFNFGDIISFKPRCKLGFRYQHFAVYVGTGNPYNLSKKDDQDIYERLRPGKLCVFSKINLSEEPKVNNYLDGYPDPRSKITFTKGTDEEILGRIRETTENCTKYKLRKNNCEHFATFIRYGHKIALQFNLTGQGLCSNNPKINKKDLVKHLKEPSSSDSTG